MEPDDLYNQLAFYTLAHPDPSFIHQLVVDAYTAQNADDSTKPIALDFALIGLYLHIEKGYTGKQVQRAHMQLANRTKTWPKLTLPTNRGPDYALAHPIVQGRIVNLGQFGDLLTRKKVGRRHAHTIIKTCVYIQAKFAYESFAS